MSFADRLFLSAGVKPPEDPAIVARVNELLAAGAQYTPAHWAEHVAKLVDPQELEATPIETLSSLSLGDVALALAAVQNDHDAVHEIERTIIEPLPRTLSRLNPTPEMIDDLRQELREKLLVGPPHPRLLDYRGRGPLGAWARVIALRAAYDRLRAESKASSSTTSSSLAASNGEEALTELLDGADPPDIAHLRQKYTIELREAFLAAAKRLDPEERAVLRSHVIDALTIDQIGALYQVHRATAARWIQHAKSVLLDTLREELARRLGHESNDACHSIVALVGSRIDLSLSRVLKDDD